ncbi:hypothetical protein JMJ77_0015061, partial [Colletotrichum scovillei]
ETTFLQLQNPILPGIQVQRFPYIDLLLRPVKHRVLGCTYSEQSNLHWSNSEDDIEDQKLINTNGWTFVHLYLQILRTKCGQHSANQQQLELRNPFSEVSL